jgi:CBS domain-containing protein
MHKSIREAAPRIFRRPLLQVATMDPMLQVATFLAIGPQIYADGLVVVVHGVDGTWGRLAGRIGGRALSQHILRAQDRWLDAKAADVMEALDRPLYESDPVDKAIQIFKETQFAFMPVARDGKVDIVASLSIRDMLPLAYELHDVEAGDLTSDAVTLKDDASVQDALGFMVHMGFRNAVFAEPDGEPSVINDRKLLEYLLSHDARSRGFAGLANVRVKDLGATKCRQVSPHESAGRCARLLSDVGTPCLFVGSDRILTPWDIIIKSSIAK